MVTNAQPPQASTPALTTPRLAEAARYALLRRLAPSMRHHLVVNLQPIGMIYEVMDRRLKAPTPNLGEVHDSAQKINNFAKAALGSCLDAVTWFAPDDAVRTTAEDGVRECLGLVATSLTFRGYSVRNDVTPVPGQVRRSSLRNVFTAALIHSTDYTRAPAEIVITGQGTPKALVLTLAMNPSEGEPSFFAEPPYRPIDAADLDALAAADGVELTREGPLLLRLALPWMAPAAPAPAAS